MNEYSAPLFAAADQGRIVIKADFLECAGPGGFCFVKDSTLLPYEGRIDCIILYKWNRKYPADLYFDIPLSEHSSRLNESMDTREILMRRLHRRFITNEKVTSSYSPSYALESVLPNVMQKYLSVLEETKIPVSSR